MKENKIKDVKYKKLIDTWCESDLMLLLKNLSHQNHKILATSHTA